LPIKFEGFIWYSGKYIDRTRVFKIEWEIIRAKMDKSGDYQEP
jgi:hypothetical protein